MTETRTSLSVVVIGSVSALRVQCGTEPFIRPYFRTVNSLPPPSKTVLMSAG